MADGGFKRNAIAAFLRARKTADRVLDRTVIAPVQRVYEEEASALVRGLSRLFRGRTRENVSPSAVSKTLDFFRNRIPAASRGLGQVLSGVTRETLTEGVRSSGAVLSHVLKSGSPLNDITVLGKLVSARQAQIEALRRRNANTLMGGIGDEVMRKLRLLPVEKASVSDLITLAGDKLDSSWWQVERVVRTETSYAYNQVQADGMRALSVDPRFRGRIYSRWTELIDDLTGTPFDNRVGEDSKALHGQVARPGGAFVMPATGINVPADMIGKSWTHPPNRPNDRAVLVPWMPDWGVPAWIYRAGGRQIM